MNHIHQTIKCKLTHSHSSLITCSQKFNPITQSSESCLLPQHQSEAATYSNFSSSPQCRDWEVSPKSRVRAAGLTIASRNKWLYMCHFDNHKHTEMFSPFSDSPVRSNHWKPLLFSALICSPDKRLLSNLL